MVWATTMRNLLNDKDLQNAPQRCHNVVNMVQGKGTSTTPSTGDGNKRSVARNYHNVK